MARDRWKRRQRDLKMGFNERQNGTVCVCNVCVCVCVCRPNEANTSKCTSQPVRDAAYTFMRVYN